jgi:integrase
MRRIIPIIVYTALRKSELLYLEWKELDLENGVDPRTV